MTTPHPDEPMATPSLDRRNFLKKGAIAGAAGVATPLLVQSVLNPAAACSGVNLTAVVLTPVYASTANGQSSTPTFIVTLPPLPAGANPNRVLIVGFNAYASAANSGAINYTVVVNTGPGQNLTMTAAVPPALGLNPYFNPAGEDRYSLAAFHATTTAIGPVTIVASIPNNPPVNNLIGTAILITSTDSTAAPVVGTATLTPSATATASATGGGSASGAQLAIFGSAGAISSSTAGVWSPPTSGFTDLLSDVNSTDLDNDVSMMVAFSSAGANQTVSATSATNGATFGTGVINIELDC